MKQQSKGHGECCKTGPGYATPLDAMSAPKETLIYVTAIYSGTGKGEARLSGYSLLLWRSFRGSTISYFTFTAIVEPEDIRRKTGLASSHCLASGDIMISFLGDKDGNAAGSGFLLDSEFNVEGRWEKPGHSPLFEYELWFQPQHKTMICTSWGAPAAFTKGLKLQHVSDGFYGRHLHVYS
ncbi:hypothetical protein TSUD_331130 [Trifolium subterraneum]|uniref:Uncharacterized protein n=1 Tax=Trifolium subterraneum TaxID=3900 RepID=A0A2Z6MJK0_TRISU|nr:hypothetical protein TSUD_331130 [Trifolium subterraneum]